MINIPIKVFYPSQEERVSHFRPFRDFTRISILNTFLVTIALLYFYPVKFVKSLTIANFKGFIRNNITHSKESNLKIASAVALGVFFGIVPLWGYQMILAGVTAHFLKLNKVLTVAASNISMPPMLPFILFGSVLLGGVVMGNPTTLTLSTINIDSLSASLFQYIIGSFALAIISGIMAGAMTLATLNIFKRKTNE